MNFNLKRNKHMRHIANANTISNIIFEWGYVAEPTPYRPDAILRRTLPRRPYKGSV